MSAHGTHNTTCSVSFRDDHGRLYAHVTSGASLFDVCRNALTWFYESPVWKGARPHRDTILEVSSVAGGKTWHVKTGTVLDWAAQFTGPDKSTGSPH